MKKNYYLGIDVSKKTLDVCLMSENSVLLEERVANHPDAIRTLLQRIVSGYGTVREDMLVCAEHTGQYTFHLARVCLLQGYPLCLENPMQIKLSIGMTRGKNDKADARRIAQYASRFADTLRLCRPKDADLEELSQLEAERRMYASYLASCKAQLTDQGEFMDRETFREKSRRLKMLIRCTQKALEEIDEQMRNVIYSSAELYRQMTLLQTIEGVGPVVALNMIVATGAFTRFDNHRQFCCYAGVAPFSYTSGTSQHSRNRVSLRADRHIKSLLHMAAVSIVRRKEGELNGYYLRKVAEGKNKMSVINAVRAKLVARMFAVVKNNRPYNSILS